MNWLKVLQMLMISSLLMLLCNCGGGGSSVLPSVVQPTIAVSSMPISPEGSDNPIAPEEGSQSEEMDPGVTASPSPVGQVSPSSSATDDPQSEGSPNPEDRGESTPPSSDNGEPMDPDIPSPEPTTGIPPEDVVSDPTPDGIPEDELDRLFPNLPPDPGEEGNQTLEGIDSDGDGVRDDVQRFIYRLFLNEELKRKAMIQYARAWQEVLPVSRNRDLSNQRARLTMRALLCAGEIWDIQSQQENLTFEIETELVKLRILNTEERVRASFRITSNLAGEVTSMSDFPRGSRCDF